MKIIIQAGGKGSRLEGLTRNKPKCLVPVNNLPIIFYAFQKFKDAEFLIIADYKAEVLGKYLKCFAAQYNYKIIIAEKKGTISGLKSAFGHISDSESFMILWCDLILSQNFQIPQESGNFVGISKDFECRWSYINDEFVETLSKENGVAGHFIFENKNLLQNIPDEGAFVPWLKEQDIKFNRLGLFGSKEIGTLLSYSDNNDISKKCRPFNSIKFSENSVIKTGINDMGKKIAIDERGWYKKIKELNYDYIPLIQEYEPLIMERINGKNIWEYDNLTHFQKKEILIELISALKKLHNLTPPQTANLNDARENYLDKTFERLSKIKDLVPFADKEFIKINGKYYKNIFFEEAAFKLSVESIMPKEFRLIHGDPTFSNLMFDTNKMKPVLIDPRGYFGKTKLYGDADYDWAKLYYSIKGDYDQFNRRRFTLEIMSNEVKLSVKSNNWGDMETFFLNHIGANVYKIKLLHAIIWLSLTTYCWEDYDSICGAFYNGIVHLGEVLE